MTWQVRYDLKPTELRGRPAGVPYPFEVEGGMRPGGAFEITSPAMRRNVLLAAKRWRDEQNPSFRYKTCRQSDGSVWFFRLEDRT